MEIRVLIKAFLTLLLVLSSAESGYHVRPTHISLQLRGGRESLDAGSPMEGWQGRGADDAASADVHESFPALRAELNECLSVESLCMVCEEQGKTNILPIEIPHFGRVVVMAFECGECGHRSNEVQEAGEVRPLGVEFRLTVKEEEDLSRQVIKSSSASIFLPVLDFEIPPHAQRGTLNTVEGVLARAQEDLNDSLALYADTSDPQDLHMRDQIHRVVSRLPELLGSHKFELILRDPSGNSFIESVCAGDTRLSRNDFVRSSEEDASVGILRTERLAGQQEDADDTSVAHVSHLGGGGSRVVSNVVPWAGSNRLARVIDAQMMSEESQVDCFKMTCPSCKSPDEEEKIYATSIPHFNKIIIMSFACSSCGYRSTDVKSGEKGDKRVRIALNVSSPLDWDRMVLKSSGASLTIPELELEVQQGSMGSSLTTVEGLFDKILEELNKTALFTGGDSAEKNVFAKKLHNFIEKMQETLSNKLKVSLIIDDPSGLSRVEPIGDISADSCLVTEFCDDNESEVNETSETR